MYKNIAKKIKGLAIALAIIMAVGCVAAAGYMYSVSEEPLSFLIVLGIPFAWIFSWPLYGFGQLIENTEKK